MVDEKLKVTEVPGAIVISSLMHQRYAEFRGSLLLALFSVLQWCAETMGLGTVKKEDDKARAALRLKQQSGGRRRERAVYYTLAEAVADIKSRVIMEAENDDDDFSGVAGSKGAAMSSVVSAGDGPATPDDVRNAGLRCRVLLRFVWESFRAGIYEDEDGIQVRLDTAWHCCVCVLICLRCVAAGAEHCYRAVRPRW
jgi:hypothetical protein